MRHGRRTAFAIAMALMPSLTSIACGSRTDLFDQPQVNEPTDANVGDDGLSPTLDASRDRDGSATRDGSIRDASIDRLLDAPVDIKDALAEDSPLIPEIDASFSPDSGAVCDDGGVSTAYLVALSGAFYTFDPPTLTAHLLGTLSCPDSSSPFTMTVSEDAAYVLYMDGNLFRVDLQSLACTATAFVPAQLGFPGDVAIATSRRSDAGPEGLLVYGCTRDGGSCVPTLARSDFTSFVLTEIGPLTPNPSNMGYPPDMREDAYGRIFAADASGYLIEIDAATGAVLGEDATGLQAGAGWAVLTWNDQLFFFDQSQGVISSFDLATKQVTTLGSVGDTIVGASAAPCVP